MVLKRPSPCGRLYQSAFHEIDTYCSQQQYGLLKIVLEFHHNGLGLLEKGKNLKILDMKVRRIARARIVPEKEWPGEFNN